MDNPTRTQPPPPVAGGRGRGTMGGMANGIPPAQYGLTNVLPHAPDVLAELPAWLARLKPRQRKVVWVACLIECIDAGQRDWPAILAVLKLTTPPECPRSPATTLRAVRELVEPNEGPRPPLRELARLLVTVRDGNANVFSTRSGRPHQSSPYGKHRAGMRKGRNKAIVERERKEAAIAAGR